MKRLLCIIFLLAGALYAQTLEKGKISFGFQGSNLLMEQKETVPFTSVSLRKDEHYIVNARAEINTDSKKIFINLELELYKKWNNNTKDKQLWDSLKSKELDIPLSLANVVDLQVLEIKTRSYEFMMLKDNANVVGKYESLEKRALGFPQVFATQNIVCRVSDTSIKVENKKYIIKGKFVIMLINNNAGADSGLIAEIRDGYFEIII